MVTTALIIMIPLCFALGAFAAVKCVQLGLRWKAQSGRGDEPELGGAFAPLSAAVRQARAGRLEAKQAKILNEYLNGGDD